MTAFQWSEEIRWFWSEEFTKSLFKEISRLSKIRRIRWMLNNLSTEPWIANYSANHSKVSTQSFFPELWPQDDEDGDYKSQRWWLEFSEVVDDVFVPPFAQNQLTRMGTSSCSSSCLSIRARSFFSILRHQQQKRSTLLTRKTKKHKFWQADFCCFPPKRRPYANFCTLLMECIYGRLVTAHHNGQFLGWWTWIVMD